MRIRHFTSLTQLYRQEQRFIILFFFDSRNTHEEWKKLLDNCTINDEDVGSFSSVNTGQETDCSIDQRRAEEEVDQYPEYDPHPDPLPDSVKLWNFVRDDQHNSATLTLINILLVVISMLVSGGNTVI